MHMCVFNVICLISVHMYFYVYACICVWIDKIDRDR